eukprot:11553128-Ditylum_brightwellii.AAC.1
MKDTLNEEEEAMDSELLFQSLPLPDSKQPQSSDLLVDLSHKHHPHDSSLSSSSKNDLTSSSTSSTSSTTTSVHAQEKEVKEHPSLSIRDMDNDTGTDNGKSSGSTPFVPMLVANAITDSNGLVDLTKDEKNDHVYTPSTMEEEEEEDDDDEKELGPKSVIVCDYDTMERDHNAAT